MTRARIDGGNWGGDPHIAGHGHGTGTPTYRPLYSHADIDRLLQDLTADDSETPTAGSGKRFATVVVGSYQGELDGFYTADDVDYLADGSGDEVTIQAAIDYLLASAMEGRVLLLEGEYSLNAPVVMKDGISLEGAGPHTTLTTTAASCIEATSLTAYSMSVRNLRLKATNASARVLKLVSCANFEVSGCTITTDPGTGFNKFGAWFESCTNVRFVNNRVHDCEVGLAFNGTDTGEAGLVVGNTFTDLYNTGIEISVSGVTVAGNTVCDLSTSGAYAIYTQSPDTAITGNRVKNGNIVLSNATFSTVSGNSVMNGSIKVESAATDCVVAGNVIRNAKNHGIYLTGSSNNVVSDNLVSGWGTAATTATYDGIHLGTSDSNSVQGNRVHTGSAGARYAINVADVNCDTNLVTNNDLLNGGGLNNAGTGTVTAAGNRV